MKQTIEVPEGYELKQDGDVYRIVKKDGLPTSWEGLESVKGYYVNEDCYIDNAGCAAIDDNRNVFATIEQTLAAIALAQITQLLKVYNGDWKPDWSEDTKKWCISKLKGCIERDQRVFTCFPLAFPTKEKRDHFLEHHRELIEKASPLLFGS